jgi:hypothetical protein
MPIGIMSDGDFFPMWLVHLCCWLRQQDQSSKDWEFGVSFAGTWVLMGVVLLLGGVVLIPLI